MFDLPNLLFAHPDLTTFALSNGTKVSHGEFSKKKDNFEFIKRFNNDNEYSPSLKVESSQFSVTVNKGFLYNMFSLEEEDQAEKFSFLADDTELMDTDFTDPASLMRRQKRIIDNINKHMSKTNFDPLRILRKDKIKWIVILCHGGKFAL